MSLLLIDVGHSRIKYGRCLARGEVELIDEPTALASHWDLVRVASLVGRPRILDSISAERIEEITPQSVPIASRYNRRSVGVDRLLGALAGRELADQMGCKRAWVIDGGTLTTVDLIEDGEHIGGFILPGLGRYKREVCEVIGRDMEPRWVGSLEDAVDTPEAVGLGIVAMFSPLSSEPGDVWIVSGGDADLLREVLDSVRPDGVRLEVVPNLVLVGLSYLS